MGYPPIDIEELHNIIPRSQNRADGKGGREWPWWKRGKGIPIPHIASGLDARSERTPAKGEELKTRYQPVRVKDPGAPPKNIYGGWPIKQPILNDIPHLNVVNTNQPGSHKSFNKRFNAPKKGKQG